MNKKNYTSNFSKVLFMIGLFMLFSCNNGKRPNASNDSGVLPVDSPKVSQPDNSSNFSNTCEYISRWDSIRSDSSYAIDLFNETGNYFTFKRTSEGDSLLHVYLAYKNNSLRVYLEPYRDGTEPSDYYHYAILSDEKEHLSIGENIVVDSINVHYIKPKDAIQRVDNWINDDLRNNWIKSCFSSEEETPMVRAFIIDYMDFAMGVEHRCYLALAEDKETQTFDIDLIVVSDYNALTSLKAAHVLLEDMVHSVPPFGTKKSAYSNFSLFSSCE